MTAIWKIAACDRTVSLGGVADSPGMYLMGMTFLRRRKSSFIHGAGDDASDLSDHLAAYLANSASLPKS